MGMLEIGMRRKEITWTVIWGWYSHIFNVFQLQLMVRRHLLYRKPIKDNYNSLLIQCITECMILVILWSPHRQLTRHSCLQWWYGNIYLKTSMPTAIFILFSLLIWMQRYGHGSYKPIRKKDRYRSSRALNRCAPPIRRKTLKSAKPFQKSNGPKNKAQVVQLASQRVLGHWGKHLEVDLDDTEEEDVESYFSEGSKDLQSWGTSGNGSDDDIIIYQFCTTENEDHSD